jgi:sugar/nucleoside kinase (ribokinase family)
MKIGCIGMTTLDTLMFTDRLPVENEDLGRVQGVYECLGGKGMVTALSVFSQGCATSFFTLVGLKSEIMTLLPNGFDSDYLLEVLKANNRTWIPISSDRRTSLFVYSSPLRQDARSRVLNSLPAFLDGIDVLYLSTEYMFVIREAARIALERELPVVMNLNSALMSDAECSGKDVRDLLVPSSSTLILNEHESDQAMSRLDLRTWSAVSSPRLQEVVITKGASGGVVASKPFEEWNTYQAQSQGVPICPVGAGDTFNGGYIKARFVEGKSPLNSCTDAARLAGQKLTVPSSSLYEGTRIV